MREGNFGTILVTGGTGWLGSFARRQVLPAVISSIGPQVAFNRHYRVTYDLSKQLIAAARKHPSVQALVYTSTAEAVILKHEHNARPVREDELPLYSLQCGPNAYSCTKAAIDALVHATNTLEALNNATGIFEDQLLTAVLRQTGHYGPRDHVTMGAMLNLVNTSATQFQIGPNKLVHDCPAHVLAAKTLLHPGSSRADGQEFFISDGKPMRFWDYAHTLWAEAGDANWAPAGPHKVIQISFWPVLFVAGCFEWAFWICTFGLVRPGANRMAYQFMKTRCWFDIGEARRVLGYEPMFGTEEGLRRTVMWFKENEGWDKKMQ
ncbi:NAD(P)-binding protein [Ophiobolus disseminans]|uniref:NAD(P)-binding protein n=1 Tax=Ophiobolus disseminans TaxID=1469910 RepID=A0A6A6ZQ55_9PLEO|nr:NAD(P)-binding protein [Ophiobolus disseminans]